MPSWISSGAWVAKPFQNSFFLLRINPKLAGTPCRMMYNDVIKQRYSNATWWFSSTITDQYSKSSEIPFWWILFHCRNYLNPHLHWNPQEIPIQLDQHVEDEQFASLKSVPKCRFDLDVLHGQTRLVGPQWTSKAPKVLRCVEPLCLLGGFEVLQTKYRWNTVSFSTCSVP